MDSPTQAEVDKVFYPWTPRWKDGRVSMDRCRASVFGERVTDWQCSRKSKRIFGGYGLCEQHAREVEIKLGLRKATPRAETVFERDCRLREAHRAKIKALRESHVRLLAACKAWQALMFVPSGPKRIHAEMEAIDLRDAAISEAEAING